VSYRARTTSSAASPIYDDNLPKDHDKSLYLWIQDGWQTEEKSVIAEAKAKSSDNPTLFAFLLPSTRPS
jgi:hypothetical protein